MKELEYPFDASWILSNTRHLRKKLLASSEGFISKKVAILGGSTTAHIARLMDIFLLNNGIRADFYESGFNRYYEEAVFLNPELEAFSPDVIYIHTSCRNISAFPQLTDTANDISVMLDKEYEKFAAVWDNISGRHNCPIIQNNFDLPLFRMMGNKDASDIHGAVNYITRLNMRFYDYAQHHDNFYICDINYLSADFGLKDWADPYYWYMYKYALNIKAIPYLAFNAANIIKSLYGRNKKGLVLDLDNTLWGGVIGDDGSEGIIIGEDSSDGEAYSEFQRYIKAHKDIGVVLAIDSKNDPDNAHAGLNHTDSILKPDDFAAIKANWNPKDKNLLDIAYEINLLPESLVFVDDNPAERHIVRSQIPGVSAPDIGEVHQYILRLDRNGYFETTTLSGDDLKRSEMYRANAERNMLKAKFGSYEEYLQSLDMKAQIKPFSPDFLPRIVQLINKSNQFNLTTKRYSYDEARVISSDPCYMTFYGRLEDRFGDNGIVTVFIGRLEDKTCHIDLWLMSCRVLGRSLEYALMDSVVRQCRDKGIDELIGYYYPTAKNSMVKGFYKEMGFELLSDNGGETVWRLKVGTYTDKNKYIITEEE